MDRRSFIKGTSLLGLGAMIHMSCKGGAQAAPAMKHKHFGLQVFGVCVELAKDIPGGFKRLKEMGYDTLELAGYNNGNIALFHDPISLIDYRKMAQDAGLDITSSHVRTPQQVYTPDNRQEVLDFWKETVERHALMGITYLVQAGIPTCRNVEDVQLVCDICNEAGRIAQDAGMLFTFHNEVNVAMRVMPGGQEAMYSLTGRYEQGARQIFDLLLEQTDPGLVKFELDGFAAILGGNDPVQYLQQYPDRFCLMHVKDREALGASGMINNENIFRQFHANGMKDFFVEDE
ncbi:MAG: sugar phosphate isomerase/epimerase, partial [Bacteroidaceae bacterium]|nr:sugar phosphate isomerase/epimerase [Bacteroidaceae bacterium]